MASNVVISGDYKGSSVSIAWGGGVKIAGIKLDKSNVTIMKSLTRNNEKVRQVLLYEPRLADSY